MVGARRRRCPAAAKIEQVKPVHVGRAARNMRQKTYRGRPVITDRAMIKPGVPVDKAWYRRILANRAKNLLRVRTPEHVVRSCISHRISSPPPQADLLP